MKKFLIIPALLFATLSVSAEILSPSAALNRAARELPSSASGALRVATRNSVDAEPLMTIAKDAGEPELYVFASEGSGVIVASAESEAPALLGYSDFYSAEADMPPSMKWLLNMYAAEIQALRAGNVTPATAAASRADFEPIEPLCATKWNQNAPFNDQCPKLNSKATYTGCVATAMAQVLNVMKYPDKCSGGTYNYYWTNGAKTLSKNFDNVTIDWKNMEDVYTANSFSAKRKAVANLMAAVGYASDMNYGTDASGTHGLYACTGLVRNFGYEYSLQYLMRDWFPLATWQEMIYDELANGIPVYYDGVNMEEQAGHAFVVDGYRSEGYFHLNWGWGGMLDGYFLLTALNPDGQQGIGGSAGGYSEQAGAMFGLKKGQELTAATAPMTFAANGNLTMRTSAMPLSGSFQVSFGSQCGMFNYSPFTVPAVEYGLKFVATDGTVYYSTMAKGASTQPYYGVSAFNVSAPKGIPAGSYTVQPVVHNPTTDAYYDTYAPVESVWRKTAVVTGATIKFIDYEETPNAIEAVEADDAQPVEYFDLGGRRVAQPASGVYIRRQGSNTQTVYIK